MPTEPTYIVMIGDSNNQHQAWHEADEGRRFYGKAAGAAVERCDGAERRGLGYG